MSDQPAGLDLGAPYHIGIVVRDLDAAKERYAEAFGVAEWRERAPASSPPAATRQPALWHGEPQPGIGARLAFSSTGPPFLELVQPTSDVEWSATEHLREQGEGVYHLGYWVDDIAETLEEAAALGIQAELVSLREPEGGGPPAGFAYLSPQDTLGVRIELVAGAGREGFLHWMSADERPAGS
ncbi:MAG TPA: VOC family protein [Dehalococcoidia bacterium]|jgi:catechol 2,3-dioxygenase-like lactoylglutathione lyase family enzyme|nr:VOC family protein [Dehalococcoidia bacterium]